MAPGAKRGPKPATSRHANDEDDLDPPSTFGDPSDTRPRCRIALCGAVLEAGECPACKYRARKYAKLFVQLNPNCECGAPKRPKSKSSTRLPKRCPLCAKLHTRAKVKGIEV